LSWERFSLMRLRARPGTIRSRCFFIYEGHNFTVSIREVSIDGDHLGSVVPSPLHRAAAAEVKVKTHNVKGD
jgi:hypothetical protein